MAILSRNTQGNFLSFVFGEHNIYPFPRPTILSEPHISLWFSSAGSSQDTVRSFCIPAFNMFVKLLFFINLWIFIFLSVYEFKNVLWIFQADLPQQSALWLLSHYSPASSESGALFFFFPPPFPGAVSGLGTSSGSHFWWLSVLFWSLGLQFIFFLKYFFTSISNFPAGMHLLLVYRCSVYIMDAVFISRLCYQYSEVLPFTLTWWLEVFNFI